MPGRRGIKQIFQTFARERKTAFAGVGIKLLREKKSVDLYPIYLEFLN
jgi:hypothetical protein